MEFHAQFMFEISPEVLVSACSTTQVLKQASLIINRCGVKKSLRLSLPFNISPITFQMSLDNNLELPVAYSTIRSARQLLTYMHPLDYIYWKG